MTYLSNYKRIIFLLVTTYFLLNNLSMAQNIKVEFSTFFSKHDANSNHCIAVDKQGNIYICGATTDNTLPVTKDAFDTEYNGNTDNFVAKFSPDGKHLIYSTFIGGSGFEHHCGIAVDNKGNVYMVGSTYSLDFPVTKNAFDTTYNGSGDWGGDVYVLKLNSTGSKLLYSTFIGGKSNDTGFNIVVDDSGYAYIQGTTTSPDFPVSGNAFSKSLKGAQDAFVAKIDTNGSKIIYSSFIGGDGMEVGQSICVDKEGCAYITGGTNSTDFPFKSSSAFSSGDFDAFVIKVNPSGNDFLFSSLIGGLSYDIAMDIASDQSEDIYITGTTQSENFPFTKDAIDTSYNGKGSTWWGDMFLTKINHDNGNIEYSTILGGSESDVGTGISCIKDNIVIISGNTFSKDLPVTSNALSNKNAGGDDIFLSIFDLNKNKVTYCTYYGGKNNEETWSKLAEDTSGNIYLMGYTSSADFPIPPGALDSSYNGKESYFITKYDFDSLFTSPRNEPNMNEIEGFKLNQNYPNKTSDFGFQIFPKGQADLHR